MKNFNQFLSIIVIILLLCGCSNKIESSDLKPLLVQQLKNTHTNKEWFVPTLEATSKLTKEQANQKDSTGNHSVREIVSHLIFWNERNLIAFKGDSLPYFDDENETTFSIYNTLNWEVAVKRLDSIQNQWEEVTKNASEDHLKEWSFEIANMASHNAYHTGQIIYIRRLNGWWD